MRNIRRGIAALITGAAVLVMSGCGAAVQEETKGFAPEKPETTAATSVQEKKETESTAEETAAVPKETETSAPTAEELEETRIGEVISEMTLHEKVCQLFIVNPELLTGGDTVTSCSQELLDGLEAYPVGGLVWFAANLTGEEQVSKLLSATSDAGKYGLFQAVDEEGGRVSRLKNIAPTGIGPMYGYREAGTQTAHDNAQATAEVLRKLGFNLDFAPVADIWSNPENKVIGDRAYSGDAEQAALLVAEAVKGFHDGGVACSLKHFPGHGDTAEDTHTGSAFSYKSLDELREREFLPFRAGIGAGADMVMTAHITVPDIDSLPASVSRKITTGLLREELGYDGVIVTDSLQMGAVAEAAEGEPCLAAFLAGADLLLMPKDLQTAVAAMEEAVNNGTVTAERLDESLARILRLKLRTGLIG